MGAHEEEGGDDDDDDDEDDDEATSMSVSDLPSQRLEMPFNPLVYWVWFVKES